MGSGSRRAFSRSHGGSGKGGVSTGGSHSTSAGTGKLHYGSHPFHFMILAAWYCFIFMGTIDIKLTLSVMGHFLNHYPTSLGLNKWASKRSNASEHAIASKANMKPYFYFVKLFSGFHLERETSDEEHSISNDEEHQLDDKSKFAFIKIFHSFYIPY